MTTSKHINHVASEYGLEIVKQENEKKEDLSDFKTVSTVMALGDVLCQTDKEKNDWKMRMLKAGFEKRGLILPDDWDSLDEKTKEARLNAVMNEMKRVV